MSYVKHFRKTLISKLFFSLFKLQDLFFSKHCLPVDLKSFFFLYKLICARSQSSYFRKTKRHLQTRIREHLQTDTKSHILHQLNENLNCRDLCDDSCFIIIDYASSSFTLKLKETLRITWLKPALNKQKNHASVTSITSLFNQNFFLQIKKNFMARFYGQDSTASRQEPLCGSSLLFTTKFPGYLGTHFIDLRRMKG